MATNTEINGKEYFRIVRVIGHEPDGTPIRKQFYGTSERAAKKKYEAFVKEQAEKKYQKKKEYDSATLGNRAEEYINNTLMVSQKYAKGTVTAYVGHYNRHLKGTWLADTPIREIRSSTVQEFYNGLDVSQHAIKELNKFMSGFVKWLQLNGYSDDFLSAVEIPKKKNTSRHDEIIVWEDGELTKIFNALESLKSPHRQAFLIRLLLYSGMRISEALGLKYGDIRDGIIYVDRQYYLNELKAPKWNSRRQIPMHQDLVKPFLAHKEWHEKEMEKNHYETEFVFTTSTGSLYHQASVRKALKRFYERHDIPYKHIHTYRATFCTQMCRCGVPLEVTSKLMGHKSLEVTAAHYALVKKDSMQSAIEMLHF